MRPRCSGSEVLQSVTQPTLSYPTPNRSVSLTTSSPDTGSRPRPRPQDAWGPSSLASCSPLSPQSCPVLIHWPAYKSDQIQSPCQAAATYTLAPGAHSPPCPGAVSATLTEAVERWWGAVSSGLGSAQPPGVLSPLTPFRLCSHSTPERPSLPLGSEVALPSHQPLSVP